MAPSNMPTAWIFGLVFAFAIAPTGVIALMGLRRRFNRKMFGRVYVWDRPWSVISEDPRVHEAFARLRLGAFVVLIMMMVCVGALAAFV